MEHQKIIKLLRNTKNDHLSLPQKTCLKQMMNHKERITKVTKLNFKLQKL